MEILLTFKANGKWAWSVGNGWKSGETDTEFEAWGMAFYWRAEGRKLAENDRRTES